MSTPSTGHVRHVETANRAKEMIDALLRQFEDVVFYLREAELPVDVLANSNLGAAYEEIKMLDGRISHLHQSIVLASSASSTPSSASPLLIDTPHHGSSFSTSTSSVSAHPTIHSLDPTVQSPSSRASDISNATLGDFEAKRVIGTGTFGTVQLLVHRATGARYAAKCLDKNRIIATRQLQHLRNERQVLLQISHPFIITVYRTLQDSTNIYFIMDYIPGGELFEYIRRNGRFSEPDARFFAAEIVEALAHLHAFGVMYRDLKPENVLIDQTGHIKLIDFGFAKVMPSSERTYTMCGTPEYISPEVILSRGHDAAVDWWSLGVLVYEMLIGEPPFVHSERTRLFEMIVTGNVVYQRPVSAAARALINALLVTNPSERLGNMQHGVDAIKNHAFFAGIDWNIVGQRGLTPPLRPQATQYKFEALPPVQLSSRSAAEVDDLFVDF